MEYLNGLLPQIDSLLAMTEQMLAERSHLDTAGRALAGLESQDTASALSTYAFPALKDFRKGIIKDIALRSIEQYSVAGEHQCFRMQEEDAYQMAWAAKLVPAIKKWEDSEFMPGAESVVNDEGGLSKTLVKCPYDRSIITVVGPNHNLHDRARGPATGRCGKSAASHQIATEFILPNSLLPK